MINQNFENITQSGTSQTIKASAGGFECTQAQFYFGISCITLVLVVSIVMITKLIQTAILRINYINPKVLEQLKEEIKTELR